MKNIIKILAALTLVAIGIAIGTMSVICAPKWVTEDHGLYIINTNVFGNVFEDVSKKESQMITTHKYIAYAVELEP